MIVVDVQASLWKRQVLVYMRLPWHVLRILHSSFTMAMRIEIIKCLKELSECDFDLGHTEVVLRLARDQTAEQMAAPDSLFMQSLLSLATSKTLNSEVETNFARATSSRSYMRGVQHDSSTMATKHCLAEIAHLHKLEHSKQKKEAKHSRHSTVDFGNMPAICDVVGEAASASAPVDHHRCRQTNGWILFRDSRLATRPGFIGEGKEVRRQRIVQEASVDYHNTSFAAEIDNFRQKAMRMNSEWRDERQAMKSQSEEPDSQQTVLSIRQLLDQNVQRQVAKTAGPWGIPDTKWPVSEKLVAESCQQKAFVTTSHKEWCEKHRGLIKPDAALQSMAKPHITFCMQLGACYYELDDAQRRAVLTALNLFRNTLRAIKKLGKHGKLPLVVFASPSLSAGSSSSQVPPPPKVFLLCQPLFKPYDLHFWECEVCPKAGASLCPGLQCPSSFTAKLTLIVFDFLLELHV